MAAKRLLRALELLDRIELFTHDFEGRRYLVHALYARLRRAGLGTEAETLRRRTLKELSGQAGRLAVSNETYRYWFTRDLAAFTLQGLEHETFHPSEAKPFLDLAEDTARTGGHSVSPPLAYAVAVEYAGYAAATRDLDALRRSAAFLESCPAPFPAADVPEGDSRGGVEDVCDGGDWRSRAAYAVARAYMKLGSGTGEDFRPSVRPLVGAMASPYHKMRGRYLLLRMGRDFAPALDGVVPREETAALVEAIPGGPGRVLGFAEAARACAHAGRLDDSEFFLDRAVEGADRAFLAARRGLCAERLMALMGETAVVTREPRHLARMEDFLSRAKPRTEAFQSLVHGAFLRFIETLARLYVETGEEERMERAKRYAGNTAPEEAVLMLAEAYLARGKAAEAGKLVGRLDDETRSLRSFAVEALARHAQGDRASFAQTMERLLNHAEISTASRPGAEAEACVEMLADAAVDAGRARFFRAMVALARRRYGVSDARYRVEVRCALGLLATARRHGEKDASGENALRDGEGVLNELPPVRQAQALLALAETEGTETADAG